MGLLAAPAIVSAATGAPTRVRTSVPTGATRGPQEQAPRRHQTEETAMSVTTAQSDATAIRPFQVDVPEEELHDLAVA